MGSKQKSQQKLPRQNPKTIKNAGWGKAPSKQKDKTGFKGYR